MKKILNYKIIIFLFFSVLVIDQIIKQIALRNHWNILQNSGIAFGLGGSFSETIIYLVLLGLAIIFVFFGKMDCKKSDFQIAVGLLLGGGISNLIDRLRFGYVLDYLNIANISYFNVGDIAILVGSILLIIKIWSKRT